MNNYEYIIASLPVLSPDWKNSGRIDFDAMLGEIRSLCSRKDNLLIDSLTEGFDEACLNEDFYRKVLSDGNGFIRAYFTLDLKLRNAKVRYLNERLGRPEGTDIFMETESTAEEAKSIASLFSTDDMLKREKNADDFMWDSIDSMNLFNYFNVNVILGFIAKLHIIDRWVRLDEGTGREMFRRLVEEVRGTFKGVEYSE